MKEDLAEWLNMSWTKHWPWADLVSFGAIQILRHCNTGPDSESVFLENDGTMSVETLCSYRGMRILGAEPGFLVTLVLGQTKGRFRLAAGNTRIAATGGHRPLVVPRHCTSCAQRYDDCATRGRRENVVKLQCIDCVHR